MKTLICAFAALVVTAVSGLGQFTLTGTQYTQDFNTLGSGLPTGWGVFTGATAASTGAPAAFSTSTWDDTGGAFKNLASATDLNSASITTAQNNSGNRALGIRQTGSFGDPGASFQFNFNSSGLIFTGLSVELMMLSVQTRSTTWSLQWSANGTAWSTLDTWSDTGTWGTTPKSFTQASLTGMNDINYGLFRIVALSPSTGSGSRDTIAIDNFTLTYTAIPEPSTYALILGAGALGFVAYRRRQGRAEA